MIKLFKNLGKDAISYIISKHSEYPVFSRNSVVRENDNDAFFEPRETYFDKEKHIAYVTTNGERPFFIIDLYPYSINLLSYALTVVEKTSPPVEWKIYGSNSKNGDWRLLSAPLKNNNICSFENDNSPRCGDSVTLLYNVKLSKSKGKRFRFIKFDLLKDRRRVYFTEEISQSLRFQKLELFGYLYNRNGKIIARCTFYLLLYLLLSSLSANI